uniref:Uncharacterized protein n=1 Tax=Rhizophora mucronata TaxID=61149 RepID=A0A2P2IZ03_RHIMU
MHRAECLGKCFPQILCIMLFSHSDIPCGKTVFAFNDLLLLAGSKASVIGLVVICISRETGRTFQLSEQNLRCAFYR